MAVVFKADSDFSKVIRDYEKMQSKVVSLEAKLKDCTKETRVQGEGFRATFEGGIGQIKNLVGGYASLSGAISLVNQGLAEQKRISEEIARVQMSTADAQAEVLKNMGAVSTKHAAKFLADIEGLSERAGMPSVAPVLEAAAQTLSAVGDEQLTKTILEKSLPFYKSKPAELAPFAGAIGDLAKISKSSTPEEIERLIALAMSNQKFSRGTSLASFENIAPAVAAFAAVDTGKDRIQTITDALAFSSAISSSISDKDLLLTRTASAEVATALAELLPEKDMLDAEGKIKRKGTGLQTTAERLAKVQADPALQRRFFETGEGFQMASFRGAIRPVIQSLVSDPNSPIVADLKSAFAGITSDPAGARQIAENLQTATTSLQQTDIARESKAAIDKFQRGSTQGRGATAESILSATLEQTRNEPFGLGFIRDNARMGGVSLSPFGKERTAAQILTEKESELRRPVPQFAAAAMGPGIDVLNQLAGLLGLGGNDRREHIQLVRDQLGKLDELIALGKSPGVGASAVAAANLKGQTEGR